MFQFFKNGVAGVNDMAGHERACPFPVAAAQGGNHLQMFVAAFQKTIRHLGMIEHAGTAAQILDRAHHHLAACGKRERPVESIVHAALLIVLAGAMLLQMPYPGFQLAKLRPGHRRLSGAMSLQHLTKEENLLDLLRLQPHEF